MTTLKRIENLEQTTGNHDAMLMLLTTIGERQQTLLEEIQAEVKEIHRDSQQTQRLWVSLARRHGWLEEDDLS